MKPERLNSMNKLLGSLMVMYIKLNNMHWNIKGPTFFMMHEEIEKLYEETREHFDGVAEKIVMYGEVPIATMKEALAISDVKEVMPKRFHQTEVCKAIVEDCTTILKLADEVPTSSVIQPLLDEIFITYDKKRWMFKATIE